MVPQPAEDYQTLNRRLERILGRLCPPWLRGDLEDLVQVAMLKIHRRGDEVGALETGFLYRVGHSVMVDEIRRRTRRKEVSVDPTASPKAANTRTLDPESAAAGSELGVAIHECLAQLSPDHGRAVVLRLQGHTFPEIGQLLGFNPKKAENLVYRGMAELRGLLETRGMTP